MNFSILDYIVFAAYCVLVIGIGLWVSREKEGHEKDSKDYFLASKALPWWAIGSSLIAANISAEQMIGMSGSGFAIGLGISAYEWIAAITLIAVAKWFLPIFLKRGIYTMPQFLEQRFDVRVKSTMAVFWLSVFVFINLTSILYLGALSIKTIMGLDFVWGVLILISFSALYSLYGGLKAVAWTDVIQVVFLIGGGLMTTYLALDYISGGEGMIAGLNLLIETVPQKFDMVLEPGVVMIPTGKVDGVMQYKDAFEDLPGIGMLLGGIWIANLSYWGCNQYIIQRALAAKSVEEAQKGLAFAGYLKILLPLIVVIPGIVAFQLSQGGTPVFNADEILYNAETNAYVYDNTYPWLLGKFVGPGLKGLAFAALVAAIVSSLSSMINSISTIFTIDIYQPYIDKGASEGKLVNVGRMVSAASLVIAAFISPLLGTLGQAFQFIQEFTGLISPGITAIFLFGLFWKRTTANSALTATILSIPMSFLFKFLLPTVPFLNRMGIVLALLSLIIVVMSLVWPNNEEEKYKNEEGMFHTGAVFNMFSIGIFVIVAFLYAVFW